MATDVPSFTEETWVEGAAPGISAAQLQRMDDQIKALTDEFNLHNGGVLVTDHPEATPSVRGLFSTGDKTKLNALPAGTGFGGTPDTITPDQAAGPGSSTLLAREDHIHGLPSVAPSSIGTANVEGSAQSVVRSDHVHGISDARLVAVTAKQTFVTGQAALSSSFTTKASIVFARPAGWSSTLVIAHGIIMYDDVTSLVQGRCRLVIDTNNGNEALGGSAEENEEIMLSGANLFTTSEGSINVAIQDKHEGTSGSTGRYAWVQAILIRAS